MTWIENAFGTTAAGNAININNNVLSGDYLTATTGVCYGIYHNAAYPATVNIQGNAINGINYSSASLTGTGALYPIYLTGSTTAYTANVQNNTVSNVTRTGTTGGTTIGIFVSSSVTGLNVNVTGNTVSNMSIDGTGATSTMYGIQASTGTINISNNTVSNLQCLKTSGTSALYGIYEITSPVNETYNNNTVHTLLHNGTGIVYGLYANSVAGTQQCVREPHSQPVHRWHHYSGDQPGRKFADGKQQ
ncbi:MAG: hypothetical protein V9F04_05290 [Dermatophilaceae bacterium]